MDTAAIATAVAVTGVAYARNTDGELRVLRPGEVLLEGETVVTPAGAAVELRLWGGQSLVVTDIPEMRLTADLVAGAAAGPDEAALQDETIDQVMAALESGQDLGDVLAPTASGPAAASGPGGEGHGFIRLGRIAETTAEFNGIAGSQGGAEEATVEGNATPVDARDDFEQTGPGEPIVIVVETNDRFPEGEDVIAISQPENGVAVLNADDTITYTPNAGFSGRDSFTYTAINPDGSHGDTAVVTVEVLDPPAPPPPPLLISIADDVVFEGATAQMRVSLSRASEDTVSVDFATADGTAVEVMGDYLGRSGTLVFAPGETELQLRVITLEDQWVENDENLFLNLSNAENAVILDPRGEITIIDDDEAPGPATGTGTGTGN